MNKENEQPVENTQPLAPPDVLIPWKRTEGPVKTKCPSCGLEFTGSDEPEPKATEDINACPDCMYEYDHANEDRCPNCRRWTGR